MSREIPKRGEIYRHFKGEYYQIICVGHHSETQEKMVVYARISKHGFEAGKAIAVIKEPCIRPLDMFMSETDHIKYPEVKQKYRFEKVEMKNMDIEKPIDPEIQNVINKNFWGMV